LNIWLYFYAYYESEKCMIFLVVQAIHFTNKAGLKQGKWQGAPDAKASTAYQLQATAPPVRG
jgi:hypothetical protein